MFNILFMSIRQWCLSESVELSLVLSANVTSLFIYFLKKQKQTKKWFVVSDYVMVSSSCTSVILYYTLITN